MNRPASTLIASALIAPAFIATLAASTALAQPSKAPQLQPTRDVVVLYRLEGQALERIPGGIDGPVRLSWDAAGQRVRAENAGRPQFALLDLRNHTGQVIDTNLRIALPLRMREQDLQPLTLAQARLTPHGQDTVAGLACNAYTFTSPQGPGTVCLTPDGVPLRGAGPVDGKPGRFTALSVTYAPLPPALFEPPPDYIALGGPNSRPGLEGLLQRFGQSPEVQSLLRAR